MSDPSGVCGGSALSITVGGSESGLAYELRKKSDNSLVDTETGTGAAFNFSASPLVTTGYKVYVLTAAPACTAEFPDTSRVTITDNTDPVINTCAADTLVTLDADCEYSLPDFTHDADLSITECNTYWVTQSPVAGSIISDTTTVTLTVTDEYGNTATCDFEVNTTDNTDPVINTCAADTLVILDADCEFTLPDFTADADLSITECSTYGVTQSPVAGSIISDTTTVTLTVTDEYGNTATCDFEVNTTDNTDPGNQHLRG